MVSLVSAEQKVRSLDYCHAWEVGFLSKKKEGTKRKKNKEVPKNNLAKNNNNTYIIIQKYDNII